MATNESTPEVTVPAAEVEGALSTAAWSIAEAGWRQVLPDLPDDVIAMLATPVAVTAEALEPTPKPEADPRTGVADCTPRFLAPAPPKRVRHRHRFA